MSQPGSEVDMDPRGDVRLRVGGAADSAEATTFRVCSRALSRASPVFDRMLYGSFAESKPQPPAGGGETADWVVNLPDDDACAMRTLLDITHGHFSAVPAALSVGELYDLTVLTHYYDATRLLAPWAGAWAAGVEGAAGDKGALAPKVLWIAWELGRGETFAGVARQMLMESQGPSLKGSPELLGVQTPPDIIERIDAIRTQTMQALLSTFADLVSTLIVVDERPRWCRHHTFLGPHRCESMILGSMTFCLARAGLWPLPDARDAGCSLHEAYRKLTSLVIHDIGRVEGAGGGAVLDHAECNPRGFLLDEVRRVVREMPSPVAEVHARWLDQQAERLAGRAR